nr:hypothetical protein [bacterium]
MFENEENVVVNRLLDAGRIDEEQLDRARKSGIKPLHEALIELEFLGQDEIYETIALELGVPYANLSNYMVDEDVFTLITEEVARRFQIFPLYLLEDSIGLAMADPRNVEALDQVALMTRLTVDPFLASPRDIKRAIERRFQSQMGSVEEMIEDLEVTRLIEEFFTRSPVLGWI